MKNVTIIVTPKQSAQTFTLDLVLGILGCQKITKKNEEQAEAIFRDLRKGDIYFIEEPGMDSTDLCLQVQEMNEHFINNGRNLGLLVIDSPQYLNDNDTTRFYEAFFDINMTASKLEVPVFFISNGREWSKRAHSWPPI
ncbi:hypothetical protein N8Z76_00505 [Gammaproteobacteria bacterium]|nr:hypothetical protein [Gammaproteobacteria bacterium]